MYSRLKYLSIVILATVALWSCGNDESGLARVQVVMVDAPGDYEQVLVEVVDVQVNPEENEGGWVSLDNAEAGIYDLIQLTNGEEAYLGDILLPEGRLNQIRLILGDNNTLVLEDGTTTALSTPSAQQSGLKVKVDADILGGVTYKLVLDFDAARSVVKAGNSGQYNLKPVIRASMEATSGAISGVITPADTNAVIYAFQGVDTIASTYADATGAYLIPALDAGVYDVYAGFDTESPIDSGATVTGVVVETGQVTVADTLVIQ